MGGALDTIGAPATGALLMARSQDELRSLVEGRYTQYQVAQSIPVAAANEGGGAVGTGMGLGAGLLFGQQFAGALGGTMNPATQAGSAPAAGGIAPVIPVAPAVPAPSAPAGETKFCMNCGNKIPRAAKFCTECGSKQE